MGYYCSDYGMFAPRICPEGFVCNEPGLITPVTPCPAGHYCGPGTKTTNAEDFVLDNITDPRPETPFCGYTSYSTPQCGGS